MSTQKPLINTSNLLRIAEHGDKLMRLAMLLAETDAPFLLAATSYLDANSSAMEIAEAFDKDLGSTAVMLKKIALIVENLNEDHFSPELLQNKYTPEQCDLRNLFPEHYKPDSQSLTIFGVKMSRSGVVSKEKNDDLKLRIYRHAMGELADKFPYLGFKNQVSILKKMQDSGKPTTASSDFEIYSYAHLKMKVDTWHDVYAAVMQAVHNETDFRAQLSFKDRMLVDEKIVGGRTMIDGVIKSSTYITKDNIYQTAAAHKNDPLLKTISSLVREMDNIRALEVDSSCSLVKVHDSLLQVQHMGIKVPDAFELKFRLLGNYKASGIHFRRGEGGDTTATSLAGFASPGLRVVAVDPNSPASLAHEIAHFCDREDTKERAVFVQHFKSKMLDSSVMEDGLVDPKYANYVLSDREIFARLGEIGFTLLQTGYQSGESFDSVYAKNADALNVVMDEGRLAYDIEFSKSMNYYSGGNVVQAWMYFDMAKWTPQELELVRDFADSLYRDHSPEIKEVLRQKIESGLGYFNTLATASKRNATKRVRIKTEDNKICELFEKMSSDDVVGAVKVVIEEGLVIEGDVSDTFARHGSRIRTGDKRASPVVIREQVKTMAEIIPVLMAHNFRADAHALYETVLRTSARYGLLMNPTVNSEVSKSMSKDLAVVFAASAQIGIQSAWLQTYRDVPIHSGSFQFESNYLNAWVMGVTRQQGPQLTTVLDSFSPVFNRARDLLFADSGLPGVISSDMIKHVPSDMTETMKYRIVANAFYQTFGSERLAGISENVFDDWHKTQMVTTLEQISFGDDAYNARIISSLGEKMQDLFSIAHLESKTMHIANSLIESFLPAQKSLVNEIPSAVVNQWIQHFEEQMESHFTHCIRRASNDSQQDLYAFYQDAGRYNHNKHAKSSAFTQLQSYMSHLSTHPLLNETLNYQGRRLGNAAYVGKDTLLTGPDLRGLVVMLTTPARALNDFLKSQPALQKTWHSAMMESPELIKACSDFASDRLKSAVSNHQVDVAPDFTSSRKYFGSSRDGTEREMDIFRRKNGWAQLHPISSTFQRVLVDNQPEDPLDVFNEKSISPSVVLTSSLHASLVSRITNKTPYVAQVRTADGGAQLSYDETIRGESVRGLLDALDVSKMAMTDVLNSLRQSSEWSDGFNSGSELQQIQQRFTDFAKSAYSVSPQALERVLETAVFAERSYGSIFSPHVKNKDLSDAMHTLSVCQQYVSVQLMRDKVLMTPLKDYLEVLCAPTTLEVNVDMSYADSYSPVLAQDFVNANVIAFEDAPMLPVIEVPNTVAMLSSEAQEQLAYFAQVNQDVPAAGAGPLMPKKHQMKLF